LLKAGFSPVHPMKMYAGCGNRALDIQTSALDEDKWSALSSGRFTPGKSPDTYSTGGKFL